MGSVGKGLARLVSRAMKTRQTHLNQENWHS